MLPRKKGITVALDITLNERLINEGICRELVNKIQTLRKDSGLQVTDKIILKIQKDNIIEKAIFESLKNYVFLKRKPLQAENLEFADSIEDGVEIQFDINSKLYLTKIRVDMKLQDFDKDLKHFKSLIEGKN